MKKAKTKAPPVATIAKGLSALRSFVDGQDKWGVRELAVALNMPPSTVHRLLARFLLEGFVSYEPTRQKYSVGFELTRLAAAIVQRDGLSNAALPVMRDLTERTGEGVWLALFDQRRHRVAYIAETKSMHALRYVAPIGRSMHLSETACGLAILASMDEKERARALKTKGKNPVDPDELSSVMAKGYSVMPAREVDSAMLIAAPVRNAEGEPIGSLAIVVPLVRFGVGQKAMLGAIVSRAAERLSSRMGARLLGGSSVGSWREGTATIADLLQRANPTLDITPALGGGGRNLEEIEEGSGAYALTIVSSVVDALQARGRFKKPLQGLRTVMHLSELHLVIAVRSDVNLQDVGDLARLRISPGEQGFSGVQTFEDMLASAEGRGRRQGWPPKMLYLDYPEAQRQIEAKTIDAVLWMTTFSNPSLRDLAASNAIRLIAPGAATMERMIARNPGYRIGKIPHRTFPGLLKQDLMTITVPTALVCRADRAEQEVYEVARTIFEQRVVLTQLSSAYSPLAPDFVLNGVTAPVHPGAERYFQSIGIAPRIAAYDRAAAEGFKTGGRKKRKTSGVV